MEDPTDTDLMKVASFLNWHPLAWVDRRKFLRELYLECRNKSRVLKRYDVWHFVGVEASKMMGGH